VSDLPARQQSFQLLAHRALAPSSSSLAEERTPPHSSSVRRRAISDARRRFCYWCALWVRQLTNGPSAIARELGIV